MKAILSAVALVLCSPAFAENDFFGLAASPATTQLQALAAKHKADVAALDAQRDAAVGRAQQIYTAALTAAENAAITASQLPVIAAVTKERVALTKGSMPVEVPPDLPATLQPARKKYLDTVAQITTEASARHDKIDVEYVRSLNGLLASANPEVAKAIEEEKLRFLSQPRAPTPVAAASPSPKQLQKPASEFSGFAKPLKDLVEGVPWVDFELAAVKFQPHDKAVPDELHVTTNGLQIQIAGTKKMSTSEVDGQFIAHWGKLALIAASAPQSGTIRAKAPYVTDGTHYGIALELADGKLKSSLKFLKEETTYNWSVKIDGDNVLFEITKDAQQVNALQAPVGDVKAFGFCSTVRYPGNKADLIVTVNPSPTIK